MKLFIDRLISQIKEKNSHICVGLDPHLDLLPSFLIREFEEDNCSPREILGKVITHFNREIIKEIVDIAVAVKPQIAFYEMLGQPGLKALEATIKSARRQGLIVILDAKRNDIGSTAEAYAKAYLGGENSEKFNDIRDKLSFPLKADALTINPYLGYDGIRPFLENKNRGAFALVRTSNPSAGDIQDLELKDQREVYRAVGKLVRKWGEDLKGEYGYSNLGGVIGATYPGELELLRDEMPGSYFLIPGYGAQGGKAEDIKAGFNEDGLGAVINSSRGIIFAWQKSPSSNNYSDREFASAAQNAALNMKNKINEIIER